MRGRGVGSGLGLGDALWLVRGAYAALLAAEGLERCCELEPRALMGRWGGPPRLWDWHAVADLLVAD